MDNLAPLGTGAWFFIGCYLSSLLLIGWLAKQARRKNTMQDFYLAGKGFGSVMLFMTLFATQYSGNTFFAFTGATYRIGYSWIVCLHFMTAIIVVYLLFAERLHVLAKNKNYLTPGDFVQDRYRSTALTAIVAIVMIAVLCNFLLAQLMAMGRAMEGLNPANGTTAYNMGVIVLALIMVIYGTLGGMRAVVWTDALQGAILIVGFVLLVIALLELFGPIGKATQILIERDNMSGTRFASVPNAAQCREWLSYIIGVGFAFSLYPQAIQRIYAARDAATLKRSLLVMAFMPLPTMIIVVMTGIIALAYLPGLEGSSADQIFGSLLRKVQTSSMFGYGLVLVILSAVLAAMMSTADSALLSLSSMLTKDIFARCFLSKASEDQLTLIGKAFSWTVLLILVLLAVGLREKSSLVQLLDRKLDLLIQIAPVFILGIRWKMLDGLAATIGLLTGIIIALFLAFCDLSFVQNGKIFGFHPGVVAIIPNLAITILLSLWFNGQLAVGKHKQNRPSKSTKTIG